MEQNQSNHTAIKPAFTLQTNSIQPGQVFTGRTKPNQPVYLYLLNQGRCDMYEEQIAYTKANSAGHFELKAPSDATCSYEGQLFRVLWEIRLGHTQKRVWVTEHGQPLPDPYLALGLKHNPFVAETLDPNNRETWSGIAAQRWLERGHSQSPLPQRRQLIQLLGVQGAGKSSHLAHWRQQQSGPYHYVPAPWHQRWKWPSIGPICYWDEACRMPRILLWSSLLRASLAGYTICAGTHRDLSFEAQFFGFSVQTIRFGTLTSTEIQQWAQTHIQSAALETNSATLQLPQHLANQLAQEAQGSWREVGARLHAWVAQEGMKRLKQNSMSS